VRVSKNANVRNLYAQLGHVLRRRCPGWRVALYAADKRLVEQIGLPFEEAFRTTNGGIKVAAMIAHVLPRSTAESG
jgi:putative N6-adenine-specific DNA methylase